MMIKEAERPANGLNSNCVGNQVSVGVCLSPSEDGKGWSERWRKHGSSGLDGLYAHQALLAHNL